MATQICQDIETVVSAIINRFEKDIRMALPLGAGKPNPLVNAIYQRAKQDASIKLSLFTALTLNKPSGKSLLEKNFLEPLAERVFGGYPDLEYEKDRLSGKLPENVCVYEFYFPAGKHVGNEHSQINYISSNYTHVARDLCDRQINVLAQLCVKNDKGRYSVSCNPDVSIDLASMLRSAGLEFYSVGLCNTSLPYMYGDAEVAEDFFDYVIENEKCDFPAFAPPKMSVPDLDYLIALNASTLVKDGGELQVGIGSLGDALIYSLVLRHTDNATYRAVLDDLDIPQKNNSVISAKGELSEFRQGLFSASEMFVDSFQHLWDNGILKRVVYDDVILQRLLNEGKITELVNKETLYWLLKRGAVESSLTAQDFIYLQKFGIFRSELIFDNGYIVSGEKRIAANLNDDASHREIIAHCLGDKLQGGAIIHGGFFLGPRSFYDWLKALPEEHRRMIHMKSVAKINQLYGHEEIDRLHRVNARFINTCLYVTLSGAAVSDGLENGQVISGVGGQYNFVAMAQELPDGHSVLQLRSTRMHNGKLVSNIVPHYGHITIPRHLRDIVVTEYGIADLRGKTDSEIIKELLKITDSRFQTELLNDAKAKGKIEKDWQMPESYLHNLPQRLLGVVARYRKKGLFKPFPFGTDFTDEEIVIGKALKALKRDLATPVTKVKLLASALGVKDDASKAAYLARMSLAQPKSLEEKLMQKLLLSKL